MEFQFGEQLQKKQFNKMSKSRDYKLVVINLSEHLACKKNKEIHENDLTNQILDSFSLETPCCWSTHQPPMLKGIIELPAV